MVWNNTRRPAEAPILDMTPDGRFIDSRPRRQTQLTAQVLGVAVLAAVVLGTLGLAFLALWLALQLIPLAIGAGLVAYGVFRFQSWRARTAMMRGPTGLRR